MNTDYFQKFIEYQTTKAISEAVHKFYSKKNDSSKISSLVNRANSLQQGDKTVMAYANELSSIYNELDFYRPPQYNSLQWEYNVQDRIYHFLEGLRPEFEGLKSQIYNRGVHESFDDAIVVVVREEGRLQQMKVNTESLTFVSHQGGKSQPFSFPPRGQDKGQEKQRKDGPFCNYCKREAILKINIGNYMEDLHNLHTLVRPISWKDPTSREAKMEPHHKPWYRKGRGWSGRKCNN